MSEGGAIHRSGGTGADLPSRAGDIAAMGRPNPSIAVIGAGATSIITSVAAQTSGSAAGLAHAVGVAQADPEWGAATCARQP